MLKQKTNFIILFFCQHSCVLSTLLSYATTGLLSLLLSTSGTIASLSSSTTGTALDLDPNHSIRCTMTLTMLCPYPTICKVLNGMEPAVVIEHELAWTPRVCILQPSLGQAYQNLPRLYISSICGFLLRRIESRKAPCAENNEARFGVTCRNPTPQL